MKMQDLHASRPTPSSDAGSEELSAGENHKPFELVLYSASWAAFLANVLSENKGAHFSDCFMDLL